MVRIPSPLAGLLVAGLAFFGCSAEQAVGPAPAPVDSVPPVLLQFIGPVDVVQGGQEVEFSFHARDGFGIRTVTMIIRGSFADTISGEFPDSPKDLEAYTIVRVPNGASIREPAIARLTVMDSAGHSASGEAIFWLKDGRPPQVHLDLGGLRPDGTIRTGETLELYVIAEDDHRLKYIGWQGAGFRDSVPATSVGDSHVFRVTVPESWATFRPLLKPWARDSVGNVSSFDDVAGLQVPVYNWAIRPFPTFHLQTDESAPVLWDAKRNTVYRLRADPERANSTRIDGVVLSSGAYLPPIILPAAPYSFSFSATGDSLVVIFFPDGGAPTLGIVDLAAPDRPTSIVPLTYDQTAPRGPYVGHAAGGRFFVALVSGYYGGRLLDVNFGTGAQVMRTDIDGGPEVANYPSLLPLPDGRLVIGPTIPTGAPEYRFVYSPTSNTFTATFRLRAVSSRQYSASTTGRFMMGNTVFGAAFDSVTTVATHDWSAEGNGGAFALSPDGQYVYLATIYGYQKVRLSDGHVIEQVRMPNQPTYLFAVPDGTKLIAVTEKSVMVVDLR